ncbi:MAG TPA: hypothetical protein VF925_04855 [Casimicrobiaceae bacterium]
MNVPATIRLAVAVLVLLVAPGARATSSSIDQSDIWWNPDESGWGIQFVHRGNIIFATMFVYGPDHAATWFTSTMFGSAAKASPAFAGDLIASQGPGFATIPFDPTAVTRVKVGSMTWQPESDASGVLAYSVNGVNVTKMIVREALVNDDYNGSYLIAFQGTQSGCSDASKNGTSSGSATLAIVQSASGVTMTEIASNSTCTLNGAYTQAGQFGSAAGTFSCSNGDTGTFTISEMTVSPRTMTATLATASPSRGCHLLGNVAGVRTD